MHRVDCETKGARAQVNQLRIEVLEMKERVRCAELTTAQALGRSEYSDQQAAKAKELIRQLQLAEMQAAQQLSSAREYEHQCLQWQEANNVGAQNESKQAQWCIGQQAAVLGEVRLEEAMLAERQGQLLQEQAQIKQHMHLQKDQCDAERRQYQQAMASADARIASLSAEKQNTHERLMKSEACVGELVERRGVLDAERTQLLQALHDATVKDGDKTPVTFSPYPQGWR